MKNNGSSTYILSDKARLNSQFSKNLSKINADPIRFYEGPTKPDEDYADYLRPIKAVRLG